MWTHVGTDLAGSFIEQLLQPGTTAAVLLGLASFFFSPGGSVVKNLPANVGDMGPSLGQEDILKKEMATIPVFLPGKSHGQRRHAAVYGATKSHTA